MIAYTALKLSKQQYNNLVFDAVAKKKQVIVFQFTYLNQANNCPVLKAYAMEYAHKEITGSVPVNLEYDTTAPVPYLSVPGEQVTGDLQITVAEMEQLKMESNINPEQYEYFRFVPTLDAAYNNIGFDVSVLPASIISAVGVTKTLNPSPPYSAK